MAAGHRIRFDSAPAELTTEHAAVVRVAVSVPRAGDLTCEVSLWGVRSSVNKGLLGRAHRRHRWPAVTVTVPAGPVPGGPWCGEAVLVPGRELPPTVLAPLGRVDYELNAVAVLDGVLAVANRSVALRATGPASFVDTERSGDGPWELDVVASEGQLGGRVRGSVTVRGGAPATVRLRVEQVGDGPGFVPLTRWSCEQTLAEGLTTGAAPAALPFEVGLPAVAVPTVVTDAFRERWRVVVSARGPAGTRELVSGLVVRG